jgi:sigma54-dependent transcription regulator
MEEGGLMARDLNRLVADSDAYSMENGVVAVLSGNTQHSESTIDNVSQVVVRSLASLLKHLLSGSRDSFLTIRCSTIVKASRGYHSGEVGVPILAHAKSDSAIRSKDSRPRSSFAGMQVPRSLRRRRRTRTSGPAEIVRRI